MLDDLNIKLDAPLALKIDGGRFIAKGLFGTERLYFDILQGDIVDIAEVPIKCNSGVYMYWRVVVKDEINVYWLHFPLLSAAFNDLALKLNAAIGIDNIEMCPYEAHKRPQDRKAPTRLRIYRNGNKVDCTGLKLPKIKGRRDYSERLQSVREIVNNILQRARAEVAPPKCIDGYLF